MGIINIPKSSTIRVLHSFGVETNPIGGSSPINVNTFSLAGYDSYTNPPQSMVLPRDFFHKTSIWVPDKYSFERRLIHTQSSPLLKKTHPWRDHPKDQAHQSLPGLRLFWRGPRHHHHIQVHRDPIKPCRTSHPGTPHLPKWLYDHQTSKLHGNLHPIQCLHGFNPNYSSHMWDT